MTPSRCRIIVRSTDSLTGIIGEQMRLFLDSTSLWMDFVSTRTKSGEVTTPSGSSTTALEIFAENFYNALKADFGNNGGSVFVVFVKYYSGSNWDRTQIDLVSNSLEKDFSLSGTIPWFEVSLLNQNNPDTLKLNSSTLQVATTNPVCTHIKVSWNFSETPTLINGSTNTSNPVALEYLRGTTASIDAYDTDYSTTRTFTKSLPQSLLVDNIEIIVDNRPTGATVTANVASVNGLNLEYSLNDADYKSTNIFESLTLNSYTLYIRDQYGCKVSKDFEVNSLVPNLEVTEPFELVSSQNSFIFSKIEAESPCDNYRNSENTLSCEEFIYQDIKYKAVQLYNSCDIIKIQFKSNYETLEVKTIEEDGDEAVIFLDKITNNLGRKDSRDANIYRIGSNKTGIYYTGGNLYDYDISTVTGTYSLNGNLPEYGVVGNWVQIEGFGYKQIEDVIIDDSLNARVLVFSFNYTASPATVIVKSEYSVANFEIYQFEIDMSFYIGERFQVQISMTDTKVDFNDVTYISELIHSEIQHTVNYPNKLVEIEYYNTDNSDILYLDENGDVQIKHKVRVELQSVSISGDSKIEVLNTDTTSLLLNANVYQGDTFVFSPLTTEYARKLRTILLHNVVNINNAGYVSQELPEIERLGNSNLYTVTADLIRSGKTYNTKIQGFGNEVPEEQEVLNLLTGQLGFLKSR